VGIGSAYGTTERIPIYERYFAGGASTIRGYEERKVGPVDSSNEPVGGDSMFIGNLEYTYPLFDFLELAAFFDTGNVWSKTGKMFSTKLKSGLGIGVRLKSPIGPIMLDYGIPLDKEPGEAKRKSGRFHFSESHGFCVRAWLMPVCRQAGISQCPNSPSTYFMQPFEIAHKGRFCSNPYEVKIRVFKNKCWV
jgi:outer membrane protein assembly factor BamA